MLAEEYVEIFDELGIYDHQEAPNLGRTLKHPGTDLPSLYFNRNRQIGVYFTGYLEDERHFPEHPWERIPDYMVKRGDRGRLNVVPMAGRERRAFESLLESLR